MMREFLMLASNYDPLKNKTEGSYLSEKLDGMRCLWLPWTRGHKFQAVLFANNGRDNRDHVCSGLWSRYGKVVFAPDWFLDKLPLIPLDGELYAGRKEHQKTMSIVKTFNPDDQRWKEVGYYVFDIPNYQNFFMPAKINNPNFSLEFKEGWAAQLGIYPTDKWWAPRRFENNYKYLCLNYSGARQPGSLKGDWGVLEQELLPFSRFKAEEVVQAKLIEVSELGGEGLILRRPHSEWHPKRSMETLKVKKLLDAEGEVIGYNYGVGKLHYMMGSIKLKATLKDEKGESKEITFDLSGFTDLERTIKAEFRSEANANPGGYTDNDISSMFPKGTSVTFTYRELTKDGKPKEARYHRIRMD